MSEYYNVAPVNHGVLSTTGSIAVGAAGGAAKSFGNTVMWTVLGFAAFGFVLGTGLLGLGVGLLPGALTSSVSIGSGLGVGALLGAVGIPVGSIIGGITGVFGAGKGAIEAHERVSMENGAARSMEARVAVLQAQAMSPAPCRDNQYNFPPQGSLMNPATASIQAGSAQNLGQVDGQQLQRA